jgi:mannose-6-phosphate isomerase-like protein (cupin superfamily)
VKRFERPWGKVNEFVSKKGQYTIATEHISPGKCLMYHYHQVTREIEVVLKGTPLVNNQPAHCGDVFMWEPGEVHGYDNSLGDVEVVVLTVSLPDFDPKDEIFLEIK